MDAETRRKMTVAIDLGVLHARLQSARVQIEEAHYILDNMGNYFTREDLKEQTGADMAKLLDAIETVSNIRAGWVKLSHDLPWMEEDL